MPALLLAVIEKVNVPFLPTGGTPPSVAVPLPLSVKVTKLGAPDMEKLGVGEPLEVTAVTA